MLDIIELFLILFNFIVCYYIYNSIRKTKRHYDAVLHPHLWSCLYKDKDYRFNQSYKSQFKEDYLFYNCFFKNKLNGLYVELGALDGYKISNTYYFEHFLGWSGILIEGSINSCIELHKNQHLRPRSEIVCSAICTNNEYVEFKQGNGVGGIKGELPNKWFGIENRRSIKTKCSNIGNILHQFHITHIDFFSLDVEGSELTVLQTFDFSILVNYWVIEFNSDDEVKNKYVRKFLQKHGYKRCKLVLKYKNECYYLPNYDKKVLYMVENEKLLRNNFSSKCYEN